MSKDFIGFTFNGVSSEELGIMRVSDGDRYDETLSPEINDRTSEVPGRDGQYYFGTDYGAKPISVSFAYDNLTEEQFRRIRQVFNPKTQGKLIFAENPYKAYIAKVESPIEMNYICFDEVITDITSYAGQGIKGRDIIIMNDTSATQRVYKGDGTISFIAYYPFAKNVFRALPSEEDCPNVDEWAETSGILSAINYNDIKDLKPASGNIPAHFKIYNPGDIETGIRIYFLFGSTNKITDIKLTYKNPNKSNIKTLHLTNVAKKGSDVGILINTDTQLIVGLATEPAVDNDLRTTFATSGNVYNECIEDGHFFKLDTNLTKEEARLEIVSSISLSTNPANVGVFYDYLYF